MILASALICCLAKGQSIDMNTVRTSSCLGLKGQVKSLKKRSYFTKLDSGTIMPGNAYRGTHFREDYTMSFNSTGLVISSTGMDPDKTQEAQWNREYQYDSLGRIIRLSYGSTPLRLYTYDSLTQKLKHISHIGSSGRPDMPESKESFFYNAKGRLIRKTDTDYHSNTEAYTVTYLYTYDAKGRIIKESKSFMNSLAISSVLSYTYARGQTLITETTHEANVPEFYRMLDSAGRLMECGEKFGREKTHSTFITYSYHANNDVDTEKHYLYGSLNSTISYQYEYDTNGNWTKMITFLNHEPHCIHLREITYY